MPQVNHPTWNVLFFLRHEHAYFQYIYSSIYDSKDQKQLNNTKKKFNLFPIIVSHIKKQKPYKRIGKQKNFWLDTKPKLLQACFKHFLAGKHQKLCSTNICKLNASITHQGPLELVLCCKINTLQFNNCSHTNTKNVCIIQTLIPYKAL